MYTFAYPLPQIAGMFTIESRVDDRSPLEHALPMKLAVTTCHVKNTTASIFDVMKVTVDRESEPKDFCDHYQEIFYGQREDWKLLRVTIDAGHLGFWYYNTKIRQTGEFSLDIDEREMRDTYFVMRLEVPHDGYRQPSIYTIGMAKLPGPNGKCTINVDVYLPNLKKVFTFDSYQPDEVIVTEYGDL